MSDFAKAFLSDLTPDSRETIIPRTGRPRVIPPTTRNFQRVTKGIRAELEEAIGHLALAVEFHDVAECQQRLSRVADLIAEWTALTATNVKAAS